MLNQDVIFPPPDLVYLRYAGTCTHGSMAQSQLAAPWSSLAKGMHLKHPVYLHAVLYISQC